MGRRLLGGRGIGARCVPAERKMRPPENTNVRYDVCFCRADPLIKLFTYPFSCSLAPCPCPYFTLNNVDKISVVRLLPTSISIDMSLFAVGSVLFVPRLRGARRKALEHKYCLGFRYVLKKKKKNSKKLLEKLK